LSRALAIAGLALLLQACTTGLTGDRFRPAYYTVRSGDTLVEIAWAYQLDHTALQRWNDIDDPRALQPGMRLQLFPDDGDDARVAERDRADAEADTTAATPTATATPERSTQRDAAIEHAPAGAAGPARWQWPVSGELVGTFDDGRVAGQGIDIGGQRGQSIRATAPGEVVYSGKGLQAYGRLLIIRHTGDFLSAYAHNQELLVGEGDRVKGGETIARMGRANNGQALLHFEIRQSGQPVDPISYLPSRAR